METRRAPKRADSHSTAAARRQALNVLYYGDNLQILRKLPAKSVDLCYIDPPFNSKRNYNQIYNNVGSEDRAQAQAFIDTWVWDDHAIDGLSQVMENASGLLSAQTVELVKGLHKVLGEGSLLAYVVSMTLRIAEIHRVLKSTGSFYLHCDPSASHYLKLIVDSVFLPAGGHFLNEIVWKRTHAHGSAKRFGPVHDILIFYAKSDDFVWTDPKVPHDEEYISKHFKCRDAKGRHFQPITLTGTGIRHGQSGKPWRGINPTDVNRHWAVPGRVVEELGITGETVQDRLDALDAAGMIFWPEKEDGTPRLKEYADTLDGVALPDIWTDIDPLSANDAERLGYPTQKPEALLERIIEASTKKGDLVLDAYCGCGTTIAVAARLGRRWIGIDITYQSIALVLERMEKHAGRAEWLEQEKNISVEGIPRDMESAVALAHKKDDRVRKEFEKWAVLTYTNNRAVINEKKGADAGIDGRVYFMSSPTTNATMVFQVKSGGVNRGDVAKLHGDMEREGAAMATLITLEEPTSSMVTEAKAAGHYHHKLMGKDYDKIQIVQIRDIIEDGRRLEMPLVKDALKKARLAPKRMSEMPLPGFDTTKSRAG